jgi:ribA/ribD-fused uncharacterized protein
MFSSSSMHQPENNILRTYVRSEAVVVYKTKDEFGGLSNMASGYPLQINGIRILTSEALYQACRFPHLPEIQREIIGQLSPMTAKMKSKPHRKNSRSDWNEVRYKVMRWCLRVKLAQNYEEFGRLLLSTNSLPIVEQSRKDDFWGAKPRDENSDLLIGQNVLGRLLMELRDKLKDDHDESLKLVPPLKIPNFNLIGNPIEIVTARKSNMDEKLQPDLFSNK